MHAQPATRRDGTLGVLEQVEFTMPTDPQAPLHPSLATDLLDLMQTAATGLFPSAAVEALIAQWEGRK